MTTAGSTRSDAPAAGLPLGHRRVVVVGGGFYGVRLALALRARGASVLLLEREPQLLTRASFANQARVHNGYHYPRSVLTALRARTHYERFRSEYPECIDDSFEAYYAIGRRYSHVTAQQFRQFCDRIGAPIREAPSKIRRLFDDRHVEVVLGVHECAFDADRLREAVTAQLLRSGVDVMLSTVAERYTQSDGAGIRVFARHGDQPIEVAAELVLNCTYGSLNELLAASGTPPISLRFELAELALVVPPAELESVAITVMDGPFFSIMPFPARGFHSLSHVRYTPNSSWSTVAECDSIERVRRETRVDHMIRDASRLVPSIRECRYVESLWETKVVLPRSDGDDSRPILMHRSDVRARCLSILGAKIDSVFDVEDALVEELISWPTL